MNILQYVLIFKKVNRDYFAYRENEFRKGLVQILSFYLLFYFLSMQISDVIEIYFYRNEKLIRVFGEVLNLKNERLHLQIWDSSSSGILNWEEMIIFEKDIYAINSDNQDFSLLEHDYLVH